MIILKAKRVSVILVELSRLNLSLPRVVLMNTACDGVCLCVCVYVYMVVYGKT